MAESDERRRLEKIKACWDNSYVPKRHKINVDLTQTAMGKWRDMYQKLCGKLGTGFVTALLGTRGNGKTQLAVCLIRAACDAGGSPRYVKAMDLFAAMRSGMKAGQELQAMEQWRKPSLLVIDEAHERGETDYEHRMLANLIDHRYDAMHDTLLIANQTPEAFAASVSRSIVSRTHEGGETLVCDWPSFRGNTP